MRQDLLELGGGVALPASPSDTPARGHKSGYIGPKPWFPSSYGRAASSAAMACCGLLRCSAIDGPNRRQPVSLDDRVQRKLLVELVGDLLRVRDVSGARQRDSGGDGFITSAGDGQRLLRQLPRQIVVSELRFPGGCRGHQQRTALGVVALWQSATARLRHTACLCQLPMISGGFRRRPQHLRFPHRLAAWPNPVAVCMAASSFCRKARCNSAVSRRYSMSGFFATAWS